ncbi:BQ2448_7519 [Microbotryum intermedium]|uniref:BQ2448_7519 protein n=1 Tax=Microbotryum intermedium TaxID=269621 RepID=A0A238FNM1_9BASI|nr:BQ2448_7519 [Microbotryum intermedium]
MTSVIGLDIGQAGSKIGAARNRGIDILINEVSNRATPSLVAFVQKSRIIGESAKTQETSNFRNTVGSLKRLIGRTIDDPDVEIEKKFLSAELVKAGNTVGVEVSSLRRNLTCIFLLGFAYSNHPFPQVNYLGEKTIFSATQLYAMFLGKLRDTAANELKSAVNDVVIAVPVWYTDAQRRAVIDAADIAGLNALRLINDTTATALGYGITKTDLPLAPEPPKYVAFVDIGHSDYSVSIVAFNKGQLVVKGTAFDRHFGGRDLDHALVEHFAAEFKAKYKIDVKSNPKALFRLAAAVEKLKKILSANPVAPLSVESIMNDVDASSTLKREELEELVAPLLERTIGPLERALADAGITKDQIETVELVGGSTRVPALKTRIQEFFGRPLSFTCNQEEAVARGATLACAMLSPVFKVRDFSTTDTQLYPIKFVWEAAPGDDPSEGTELVAFDKGNAIPSTKVLSFSRNQPFDLEARYANPEDLPGKSNPWIGKFTVKNLSAPKSGGRALVKVKAKLNLSGILTFDSATLVEEGSEEDVPEPEAMETDALAVDGAAALAPTPVKKARKSIKTTLPAISSASSLDPSLVNDFKEKEGQMHASDKLVLETEDRKNALEEYVYDVRDKLEGAWKKYSSEADKEELSKLASEAEDWLYTDEGEDATKSAYVARLEGLKALGDPIALRYREHEERPRATAALREIITGFLEKAQSGDEKYSHIAEKDLSTVIETCANAEAWLGNKLYSQQEKPLDVKPVITSAEIRKKGEEVQNVCLPIMTKPKPRAPKTERPKTEEKPTEQTPDVSMDAEDASAPEVPEENKAEGQAEGQAEMHVDELD